MSGTIYGFTAMNAHCSTYDDPNDCYTGHSTQNSLATSNSSSATLSRTTVGTDSGGTEYYMYAPTYISAGTESSSPIKFQTWHPGTPFSEGVWIPQASFASNELPAAGQYIYLQLFADTSQPNDPIQKVLLKARTSANGQPGTYTSSGWTYRTFDYVSSSFDPICLTDTCDILTPNGYVNVKDLSVGDLVTTPEGKDVKITKIMKPTNHVAMGKALPHFIPKNSLGENKPSKDTFVSKNHAYKSGDRWLCGQFNIEHNAINWDKDFVTYYNIMTEDCPKHSLVVNGVEMESWSGYEHNKPETHGNSKLRREKLGFK